jgi:hypothetical protein
LDNDIITEQQQNQSADRLLRFESKLVFLSARKGNSKMAVRWSIWENTSIRVSLLLISDPRNLLDFRPHFGFNVNSANRCGDLGIEVFIA